MKIIAKRMSADCPGDGRAIELKDDDWRAMWMASFDTKTSASSHKIP